jgi:flagellar hook-associated protein 2
MSISPLVFTGVSKYSTDFQTILSRAVSIASLPVKNLQNQQADLLQKKQISSSLNGAVASLAASLKSLAVVGDNHAITATSSNAAKVSINSTNATNAGSYAITEITSVARSASETTISGYANSGSAPVSSTGVLQLKYAGQSYGITLAAGKNNLLGLRDAINNLGVGANASVLTTGSGLTPNYLSLSAGTTGATTLQLIDDPSGVATNLVTSANQGANAVFKLNGVAVSKSSNLINDVVPGVSFNILDKTSTGESIAITLSSDRGKLAAALSNLAANYNAVVKQVDGQVGANAGLLTGDFLIRDVQGTLRQLTSFQGTGIIKSFADIGLTLSSKGELSFDQKTFDALSDTQVAAAFTYAGSSVNGFGGLASKFTQISDPVSGLIKIQQDQYDQTDHRLTDQISTLTDRIAAMQATLSAKLQQADALLASLDSQQSILTSSLQSLTTLLFGKAQ